MSRFEPETFEEEFNSPEKLHELALHYNWDDGVELPRWIINNPICDRGTALLIYWHAGAGYYCQYTHRQEVSRYQVAVYDLVREIEQNYLGGFYKNQSILFNPRYDTTAGQDGYDHTQTYDDLPQKSKIPDEMTAPSIPDVAWEAMGKPIKPIKQVNYNDLLASFDSQLKELEDESDSTDETPN